MTYNALRSFLVTRVDQQLAGGRLPGRPGPALVVGPRTPGAGGTSRRRFDRHRTGAPRQRSGTDDRGRFARSGSGSATVAACSAGARDRGVLVPPGHLRPAPEHQGQGRGPPVLRLRRARHRPRRCIPAHAARDGPARRARTTTSRRRARVRRRVAYRALAKPLTERDGGDRGGRAPRPISRARSASSCWIELVVSAGRCWPASGVLVVGDGPARPATARGDDRDRRRHRQGGPVPAGVAGDRGDRGGPAGARPSTP